MNVKTRFAPSPTGMMHVGSVRTALFAWLVAKQAGGQFILRIEDTDKSREVDGSIDHIIESLKWLGIEWDEGPDIGGPNGPYRQSERLPIYKEWAEKLIENHLAYVDPYTKEELESLREKAKKQKLPFLFREHRPKAHLKWDGTKPLRLRCNPKSYKWNDAVMGDLSSGPETIDDFIIMKSDGYPTYNFAHIIDDHLMKVSHVIRSQEFLSSVPRFLNLYEALGFKKPVLATLPFVMAIDGKKKLSKRDGAKDVLDYAREGYPPSAIINFLSSLGWNDGTEQEIFTVAELIDKFSLTRVQKSGAKFDYGRLKWISGHHIRSMPPADLYASVEAFWPEAANDAPAEYKKSVLTLVQERLKHFDELPILTNFFFEEPKLTADMLLGKKTDTKVGRELLEAAMDGLATAEFTVDGLEQVLRRECDKQQSKPVEFFGLIRRAVTGGDVSPGLFETLELLGKQAVIGRLQTALELVTK